MTNEEKAVELLPNIPTLECLCCDIREKLVEMAEWKDKQFEKQKKEFLDKACKWLRSRKCWDFYDDAEAKTFSEGDIKEFRKYMEG